MSGIDKNVQVPGCMAKVWKKMRNTSMIIYTVIAVLIAVGIGLGLSSAKENVPELLVYWLGIPGKLFIRSLYLVVVPLVFCSVVLGIVGITEVGGSVGKLSLWVCLLYGSTTIIGVFEGLAFVQSFRFAWEKSNVNVAAVTVDPKKALWDSYARISVENKNYDGYYNNSIVGKISITFNGDTKATDVTELFFIQPKTISFRIPEMVKVGEVKGFKVLFVNGSTHLDLGAGALKILSGAEEHLSTSESASQSIKNLLYNLLPKNALGSFVGNADKSANLLSMIMFALAFGVILTILKSSGKITNNGENITTLLKQILEIVMYLTNKIMLFTPIAVASLIISAFGSQSLESLGETMSSLGILFATIIMAFLFHLLVFQGILLFSFTRHNIFKHYFGCLPAMTTAFACSSSASTLPTTISCVEKLGASASVSKFVLSLGATINMDGSAIFLPAIEIWLASTVGIKVDVATQIIICIVSALTSMGSSPAPGLTPGVLMVFHACFPGQETPETIAYVLALDWLLDRCLTTLNVSGDTVIARIVDHKNKQQIEKHGVGGDFDIESSESSDNDGGDVVIEVHNKGEVNSTDLENKKEATSIDNFALSEVDISDSSDKIVIL
eukprot:Pgem_evm1s18484